MPPYVYFLIGGGVAFAALIITVLVVLIRALAFRPKPVSEVEDFAIEFDREGAVEGLRALVRCRTVSNSEPSLEDDGEFQRLYSLLPELYPEVYRECEIKTFPGRALLYRWRGRVSESPTVLMAHYDVVPVNEDSWDVPPFDAVLRDGVIWGRGTLDTKVTFASVLFSANKLISEGYVPERDIYFAFSGGEEVSGPGASNIVDYFEECGITPGLVLDEGGAVVLNVFPGLKEPSALIGVAEKGFIDLEYKVKSSGGHASAPKPHTPVGVLARACTRVEERPFKSHLTPPVKEMFDTLGRHSGFLYRMVFANLWLFKPVIDMICLRSGGELNALMRTTVAFTQMEGSSASNVIPPDAKMVSNIRLNPMDTVDGAVEEIRRKIGDESVELRVLRGTNPSPISHSDTEGFRRVAGAIRATWRGAVVSPYLMMQCSDSRHWGKISDRVYRFSAMDLTKEERATIHGNNERIRTECLFRATEFYIRLMREC